MFKLILVHPETKVRAIFSRFIRSGGYDQSESVDYKMQIQDNRAIFTIVNLDNLSELEFLQNIQIGLKGGMIYEK